MTSVAAALQAIQQQGQLNAVITVCSDEALERERGDPSGPLAGIPLLVKDLIDTAGVRTTYGSRIYADHVPTRTAPVVERLVAAGAIIVGKSNLDEFAWGVTGQNPHWGDVGNPRLPGRISGGSSAGSAAGVAAGLCALALGTDTGGSIRMPSACCGTVGYKPSFGKISTEGCYPLCPSFDTVGPIARSVAECALAYSVLAGEPVPEPRLSGLDVGVLTGLPAVAPTESRPDRDERALFFTDRLEALGARVREIELPVPDADLWPLFYFEAGQSHRATFPSRRDEYGPICRAKLDLAQTIDLSAVEAARRALAGWQEAVRGTPDLDLIVSPTLGVREIPPSDVDELEIRLPFSAYTRIFNFLGWPAIAIGQLQLAGRDDATVLGAALAWEAG